MFYMFLCPKNKSDFFSKLSHTIKTKRICNFQLNFHSILSEATLKALSQLSQLSQVSQVSQVSQASQVSQHSMWGRDRLVRR